MLLVIIIILIKKKYILIILIKYYKKGFKAYCRYIKVEENNGETISVKYTTNFNAISI